MKYDDASWHYGGDFPKDLPDEAGATHTGMFLAWALHSGLAGEFFTADFPEDMSKLLSRSVTPGRFFLDACDGKFTSEELNDVGNRFAAAYYDPQKGHFLADYEATIGGSLPTLYHAPDSWGTYELLRPVFDRRFREWNGG